MSHTFINYPSDTNRITRLVSPGNNLNGSAAALNASIKALTDAITAAQAVLATLVPYTGATTTVDVGSQNLTTTSRVTMGQLSSDGGSVTTDGSGNMTVNGMSAASIGVTGTLTANGGVDITGVDGSSNYITSPYFYVDSNGDVYSSGHLNVSQSSSLDGGAVTTDGGGNLTIASLHSDGGQINTDGSGDILDVDSVVCIKIGGRQLVSDTGVSVIDWHTDSLPTYAGLSFDSALTAHFFGAARLMANYASIASPTEGMLAWDFTNHVPVVSDGTYWYPFTLGAHY